MAGSLRELFGTVALKAGEGLRDLKSFNKGLNDAEENLEETESNARKLGRTFRKVGSGAAKFGKSIATGLAVGSAAVVGATIAVNAFVGSWAEGADEILKRSQKLGIATDQLQKLRFAADLAGASADSVSNSVRDLEKFILEANRGQAQPFVNALKSINVGLKELEGKDHVERLAIIADGLATIKDEGQQSAIAARLLGRSAGIELAPLLKGGGKALREAAKEAEALGGVMSGEALNAAAEYNDAWARLKLVVTGVRNEVGAKAAPVITKFVRRIRKWATANREVIATKITEWLDKFIKFLERAVPAGERMLTMIGDLVEGAGGIESAIRAAAEAWAVFQLAGLATLGPGGAIAAAIGLTLLGIARVDRELKKARNAAISKNIRLRNLDDPTAGLSFEQITSPEGTALREATSEAISATQRLKALKTREDLLQSEENRLNAIADTFAGAEGEIQAEATKQQIKARQDAIDAAETRAERAQALAASEREKFDIAQQKKIEAKLDEQTAAGQALADQLAKAAKGDDGKDGKGKGAKAKPKKPGEPGKPPTQQEQFAAAFGGRQLKGSALAPKSIGTTINQVDARVQVTVAKVEQSFQLPAGASPEAIAVESATRLGEVVTDQVNAAVVRHRSIFVG